MKTLTPLDQLLISLIIAGPCQMGFLMRLSKEQEDMSLRFDKNDPKVISIKDIYKRINKNKETYKSDNIKLTIEKDILLGEPVLLLNIEVFDVISNVILDGSDVLRIANIALEMIKALSGMERQWLDDSFTVINVVWHFPHCQD